MSQQSPQSHQSTQTMTKNESALKFLTSIKMNPSTMTKTTTTSSSSSNFASNSSQNSTRMQSALKFLTSIKMNPSDNNTLTISSHNNSSSNLSRPPSITATTTAMIQPSPSLNQSSDPIPYSHSPLRRPPPLEIKPSPSVSPLAEPSSNTLNHYPPILILSPLAPPSSTTSFSATPLSKPKYHHHLRLVQNVSAMQNFNPAKQHPYKREMYFTHKKTGLPSQLCTINMYHRSSLKDSLLDTAAVSALGTDLVTKSGKRKHRYAKLLIPSKFQANVASYQPYFLDDPDLRSGKKKRVLTMHSFIGSIIPFVNSRELKEDLNAQFRDLHPSLPPSLTLSKIRNLKKDTLELASIENPLLDVSTVALAHVYFERLVLKKLVRKQNRRVVMGACLLIAFKFNQPTIQLAQFFEEYENIAHVSKRKILEIEFDIFVELEFALFVPEHAFHPHYTRLLQQQNLTPLEYLGEFLHARFYSRAHHEKVETEVEQGEKAQEEEEDSSDSDGGEDSSDSD